MLGGAAILPESYAMTPGLPSSWSRMGFRAKAEYLVSAHLAKDLKAAFSMLKAPKPAPVYPPRELWYQKD